MHSIQTPETICPDQLKNLLYDLANLQTHISIKLETAEKNFSEQFSTVLVFEEHALLLTHLPTRSVLHIPDVDEVTGFMIDKPYQLFQPFERYDVRRELSQQKVAKKGSLYA